MNFFTFYEIESMVNVPKFDDWEDDEFGKEKVEGSLDLIGILERLIFISKYKEKWEEINIYDYDDGLQLTLTHNCGEMKILLKYEDLQIIGTKLANIVYEMSNLDKLSIGSRFPGNIERIFNRPLKIETISLENNECLKFFKVFKVFQGVERVEFETYIYEDEDSLIKIPTSIKSLVIDEFDGDGDQNDFEKMFKLFYKNTTFLTIN